MFELRGVLVYLGLEVTASAVRCLMSRWQFFSVVLVHVLAVYALRFVGFPFVAVGRSMGAGTVAARGVLGLAEFGYVAKVLTPETPHYVIKLGYPVLPPAN